MFEQYFNTAIDLLNKIKNEQKKTIEKAGKKIAESIEGGGIVYLFGCGHSHILTEEVFYRAGGLAPIYPIFHEPLMLHEGAAASSVLERKNDYADKFMRNVDIQEKDIIIVISTSGRNPVPIDVAKIAKEKGAFIVVLTSLTYSKSQPSRHISGQSLFEMGNIVIDNGAVSGDAVLSLPNLEIPFASTSTLTGVAILQSIFAESIEQMEKDNFEPPIFLSGNTENADKHNEKLLKKYEKRIPLLTKNL
ncbi:SIS domain-containing protein [Marinilactibacillus psychrotolerans]|uniref:UPF0309 protein FEZ48_04990 n=1 Tax=Marinilactibacillus psychrotolerans TaxID=191770 RepID=A0A5R9C5C4_9LACT|nr:SIS domain-containing protein [Marinilactibacillus psychrotolerans]TLQ08033.1 SIS domain-containing protein [Marinilactibacillus psychrotolerans]